MSWADCLACLWRRGHSSRVLALHPAPEPRCRGERTASHCASGPVTCWLALPLRVPWQPQNR